MKNIDRREFLKRLGMGTAAISAAGSCRMRLETEYCDGQPDFNRGDSDRQDDVS